MRVSVIVNTYNRAQLLGDCLRSLYAQRGVEFEVIVVNGPSDDGTDRVLEPFSGQIKIGRCAERNLSISRNIGINLASGDICAFLDDDAVAHPTWLARLAAPYADDAVAAVGGFTFDHTGMAYQCRYTICDRHGNAQFFDQIDPAIAFNEPGSWWYPSLLGTNCSFRRLPLQKIGGFDETFAYMLDETDVCLRLFDRGWQIKTVPNAFVFHRYAPSHNRTPARIPKSLLASSQSKAHFCAKHRRFGESISAAAEEIERYRRDLEFSNRWHLDHGHIGATHFAKLQTDLRTGLMQGLATGLGSSGERGDLACRTGGTSPFMRFLVNRGSEAGLRLCLVSQGYPPADTSGIARWTSELASGLHEVGHEVHVITATPGDAHVDYVDGIWVHAVPPSTDPARPAAPVAIPDSLYRRALAVYDEIRRIRSIWGVDLVSAPIWDLEGIICARYFDIPVVTSLHSTYSLVLPFEEHWQSDLEYRYRHVQRVIDGEKWLVENSAGILANSTAIIRDIERVYSVRLDPNRVAIVPHGVSNVVMEKRPASRRGGPMRILFVGRIERRKGLDILLEALLSVIESDSAVDLLVDIVGANSSDGEPDFARAIHVLSGRIDAAGYGGRCRFHGYVDDHRLFEFYANCDVFVAPSRYESFGLIAIEAMRFGKPVIVSRVGGLQEIVRDGVDGYWFDPERPLELAEVLLRLLKSPKMVQKLGAAARRRYEDEYTIPRMAHDVAGAYNRMFDRPGGALAPAIAYA